MNRMLVLLLACGLAAAPAAAQPRKEAPKNLEPAAAAAGGIYRYLPQRYGDQAAFTQADLIALRFTAYNGRTQRIGARLVSLSMQADARPESLVVSCYCELVEKEKQLYLGDGRFSCPPAELPSLMQDGVEFILALVKLYFPELDDRFLVVNLVMKGTAIGRWRQGQLAVLAAGK